MGRAIAAMKAVASKEWVMLRWGKRSSMKLLRGKKILPIVLVVVSRSGNWLPKTAKPNANGSAVERMRETPAAAMSEWVMDMKARNIFDYQLSVISYQLP